MEPTGDDDEGVYVTEHVLELEVEGERTQLALLNVPPLPPSLHVTVPVGADGTPEPVSATVAVNGTGETLPTVSEVVLGATVEVVVLRAVPVTRWTVKLFPSDESADVLAITLSLVSTMSMDWIDPPYDPIGASVPPTLA